MSTIIELVARIIDPEAFELIFVGDKPILERTLIRDRQIVAEYRAGQIIDALVEEFPKALAILLREESER
jgi:hypothetical protein